MQPLDNETFDAFLSGELDSLEGPQEALEVWEHLKQNASARKNYERVVNALRELSQVKATADGRLFCEAEADAMWPLVFGSVLEGARNRSGLSKQALRHLAVPALVNSICAALTNMQSNRETVLAVDMPEATGNEEFEVSIAKVDGAVSLRLYKSDGMDVRSFSEDNATKTNVDGDQWAGVNAALKELSRLTGDLLKDDALVNGRVTLANGRAEIHLVPLHLEKREAK
ncbi:MAG: hypothetical protein IT381_22885 [Deltaproteobacteria bacterium]|nr:hypothetical protein [Deltaproteobacteria bacterium]